MNEILFCIKIGFPTSANRVFNNFLEHRVGTLSNKPGGHRSAFIIPNNENVAPNFFISLSRIGNIFASASEYP